MSAAIGGTPTTQAARPTSRAALIWAAILIASVKLVEFAIDSQVLFHSDSAAYIQNALGVAFIPFRSYVYAWLIRLVALPFHSPRVLVVVQCLMGGITAWLLCYSLLKFFGVRLWLAIACALGLALDPVQVMYERLVLSESTALLLMAIYLVIALTYLRERRLLILIGLSFVGVLLVSLRLVYVPVVYGAAGFVPLIAWVSTRLRQTRVRALLLALLVSYSSTVLFQCGYKYLTGRLANREPAYHYWTGFFLLATVSPMLRPSDTDDPRLRRVLEEQKRSDHPPTVYFRNEQMWASDGLRQRVIAAFNGNERAAEQAAGRFARTAIDRRPLQYFRLGVNTYLDYWRGLPSIGDTLASGLQQELPQDDLIYKFFGERVTSETEHHSLAPRYYFFGRAWHVILLLSPCLFLLDLCCKPANWRGVVLLLFWTCSLFAATCLAVGDYVYRYLHPFSYIAWAGIALICNRIATLKSTAAPVPTCIPPPTPL